MSSGLDASSSAIHPQSSTLDLGASLSGSSALLAPGCSLLGRSSVIDAHLHAESAASYNSRSDRVLRLRRSYALSRDAHHAGLLEPGQSLSQLRHAGGYGRRHHPLSRSLPSLARDGGDVGDVGGRRKRPRAGLRPAPRTKAESDMLFHGARGSIFAKHVVRAGLPDKSASSKQGKRRLYPSGFSGERSAKTGKLYPIKAHSDMDAIRAYHTMSANLASVEQLSLSLMSFVEDTTGPGGESAGVAGFDLHELPVTADGDASVMMGGGGYPPNDDVGPDSELRQQQERDDNWQLKPDHYSGVGAFGMSYDDHGQGRGTSDFGSDIGGADYGGAVGGSQLLRTSAAAAGGGGGAHRGPEGANDAGTGPFRFIMLASQGGGGGENNNNNTGGGGGRRSSRYT